MATKTYNAQTLLVAAKPRNKRLREIGYQGGSSATVDVDLTPYLLKATFDDLFEKVNLGTDSNPQWTIKAKMSLWTEGFLSAKGVGDGSAEGGVGYEAVQEMIAEALQGYNPSTGIIDWDSITGKPDTFAPSAHSHSWGSISDKPTTFAPSAHNHTKSDITDFAHVHAIANVTGLQDALDGKVPTTRTISAGTGLTGGGALSADRTISLNATNVGLLQMLADMFEWATVAGVRTIKAKASLWTDGYLSAKGTSSDSSASGLTAEAVQEMIDDALVGYTPGDGVVEWTDIVGKPDTFAPSSHTHSYLPLTGGTLTGGLTVNGTISAGAPGEGNELLRFNSERPWVFVQESAGSSTGLALKTTANNKSFVIRAYGGQPIAAFYSADDSSSVTLGNNNLHCTYSGNVGIGTASPAYKLDVNGSIRMSGSLTIGSNVIIGGDAQYMLGHKPTETTTGVSATQWFVGASDSQGVIRSNNTNLIHYRNGASSPSSVILDSANYSDYAVPKTRKVSTSNGLTGGGDLTQDRTIKLTDKNAALLAMLDSMFEVSKVNGVDTIKAKMSLWTDGYLSAKGTSNDSSASGLTAEAVQEMIDDALVGYTPGDGIVEWTDIVGKPDTFAPSSHTHSYLPLTGGTLTGSLSVSGNVGIGTASPAYKLDVNGTMRASGTLSVCSNTSGYAEGIRIHAATNGWATLMLCGAENTADTGTSANSWSMHAYQGNFYLNKNSSSSSTGNELCNVGGNWGIGTVSPDAKLHVAGAVHATNNITSDKECVSKFTTSSSDERLKRVTGGVDIALRSIAEAPSIRFDWRDGSGKDAGSIAQYWQDIVPEAVRTDSKGYLTMQYGKLALLSAISLARNAVGQELEIEQLKQRVEQLEREVERLSA